MGAAALTADLAGVCVPLAVGSAVGSSCAALHERCGHRVCVMDASAAARLRCADAGCASTELPFAVMGVVHTVHVVRGVVGTFTDNEPVLGVRARTLPYTQAIGRQMREKGSPAAGRYSKGREVALGDAPLHDTYTFDNFLFLLPGMQMQDEVVIAFGTRTVVRLPLLGASNAPLDFDVLGSTSMPLMRLLQSSQPVEVAVPIQPRGESLPQVARAALTFGVAPPSLSAGRSPSAEDTDTVEPELLKAREEKAAAGQCASFGGAHQFNAV